VYSESNKFGASKSVILCTNHLAFDPVRDLKTTQGGHCLAVYPVGGLTVFRPGFFIARAGSPVCDLAAVHPILTEIHRCGFFQFCRLYHCYHLNPSVWPGLLFVHLSAWDFAGSLYQVISHPPETNKYLQAAIIYHFPFCFGDLCSSIVLSEHIFFKSAGSLRIKREGLCGTERHTGPFPLPVVVFHASQYVEKPMVL
jgi:hypothetical protein